MKPTFKARKASIQGSHHQNIGLNNQDSVLLEAYQLGAEQVTYVSGLVSDGVTGIPAFSKSEAGSALSVVYFYGRLQELTLNGADLQTAIHVASRGLCDFLRSISIQIIPSGFIWPYPKAVSDGERYTPRQRFLRDYLSATLCGFFANNSQAAIFAAGDGCVVKNGVLTIFDQNNTPKYPTLKINTTENPLDFVELFNLSEPANLAVASDGLQHLLSSEESLQSLLGLNPSDDEDKIYLEAFGEKKFIDLIFSFKPEGKLELQKLLRFCFSKRPDLMKDDCSIVTLTVSKG